MMHPTSLLSTSSSVWAFLHWQTGPACGHPHLLWLSASMQMEETWSPCTDLSLDVVTSKQLVQQPQTPTPPKCCTLQLFRTHLGAYTSAVLVLKFVCVGGGGGGVTWWKSKGIEQPSILTGRLCPYMSDKLCVLL